jgi:hypothetical protein
LQFEASLGKLFARPYFEKIKKPFTKWAGGMAKSLGPEFKPQYSPPKKKKVKSLYK